LYCFTQGGSGERSGGMPGKLIVLEGGDASGKTTQFELLGGKLGGRVKTVCFPQYGEPSAALIEGYLSGKYGSSPYDVNPYIASSFFAVDRAASFLTDWGQAYNGGKDVFAYRYTTSNAIYNAAKLPKEQWQVFWEWLEDFEYGKLKLPKPDMVLFLDVPPDISTALLSKRKTSDIHEDMFSYRIECHSAAIAAADYHDWHKIHCAHNGTMRAVEDINEELYELICQNLTSPR
jgi:dTMP kinase